MTPQQTLFYTFVLVGLGAGWGFTMPMTKIAVSEGYLHFGLIFWQLCIGVVLMATINRMREKSLPLGRRHLRLYFVIAMIGTVVPNAFSYQSAIHLPAGVISILMSMVPILAFPIALAFGLDRLEMRRLTGLLVGLAGVLLIVAPGSDLSGTIPVLWVGAVLVTCAFYAFEGNYVARWGTEGLDALQVLFGASLVGLIVVTPMVWYSGQWIDPRPPWGAPDFALAAASVAHVLVYAGYVWLVGRAGPVFTAQVSYLVTLCGLFWSKLILAESYSPLVWLSLMLMVLGLYLVQPRPKAVLAGS